MNKTENKPREKNLSKKQALEAARLLEDIKSKIETMLATGTVIKNREGKSINHSFLAAICRDRLALNRILRKDGLKPIYFPDVVTLPNKLSTKSVKHSHNGGNT